MDKTIQVTPGIIEACIDISMTNARNNISKTGARTTINLLFFSILSLHFLSDSPSL